MVTNGLRRIIAAIHLLSTLAVILYAAVRAAEYGRPLSPIADGLLIAVLLLHSSAAAALYSGRPWPSLPAILDALRAPDRPAPAGEPAQEP